MKMQEFYHREPGAFRRLCGLAMHSCGARRPAYAWAALLGARRPAYAWAALLALLAIFLAACAAAGAGPTDKQQFPSFVYASSTSLEAYRTAVAIPDVLAAVPCYCGCASPVGHKSLKECFIKPDGSFDEHASACDLCAKEALDVAAWHKQGKTRREIRTLIDEKYQGYGKPTDTPLPE